MFYGIPEDVEAWDILTIKKIATIGSIEGNYFDMKGKNKINSEINEKICGFANTNGGYIVFGISEDKEVKNPLKRFSLDGFDKNKTSYDDILQTLANKIYQIEPIPEVKHQCIEDGDNFYVAIQIISSEDKKPYFTNNGFYVRIGNTTKLANRSLIISMLQSSNLSYAVKDKHKEYILQIFSRIQYIHLRFENGNKVYLKVPWDAKEYERYKFSLFSITSIEEPSLPSLDYLERINHLSWAISHLQCKDYMNLYFLYSEIMNKVDQFNSQIEKKKTAFMENSNQDLFDLRFEHLEYKLLRTQAQSEVTITSSRPFSSRSLLEYLFEQLIENGNMLNVDNLEIYVQLRVDDSNSLSVTEKNKREMLMFGNETISINDIYETLNDVIVKGKGFLKEQIKLIDQIRKYIDDFEKGLGSIVNDLTYGDSLKGYCKIGY